MNDPLIITQVGHFFWVLGGLFVDEWNRNQFTFQEKTSVFSLRREIWFNGPDLPEALLVTHAMYCATSLNQTNAIFIGVGETMRGVILFDFVNDMTVT